MKSRLITTFTCLVTLLIISSFCYAASNAVTIGSGGIIFPDNSVQKKAAELPTCTSGDVLVNNSGSWYCGKVMPVDKGIISCVGSVCSVSACMPGFGDCDGILSNGCETNVTTTQNCGCGVTCPVSNNECITYACINGSCTPTYVPTGSICSGGTCNGSGTCSRVPTVTSITPNQGLSTAPTNNVLILGTNFEGTTIFKIGSTIVSAGNCTLNSATSITCTLPGTGSGNVYGLRDVTADNGNGLTGTLINGWRYIGVGGQADWCNITWPPTISAQAGSFGHTIYGQIYKSGITDLVTGSWGTISAQAGYGPVGTDPTLQPVGWTYIDATFNMDKGLNDEYRVDITAPSSVGVYFYVYRFSLDNGASYSYCDLDGTANGFSSTQLGVMTVTP